MANSTQFVRPSFAMNHARMRTRVRLSGDLEKGGNEVISKPQHSTIIISEEKNMRKFTIFAFILTMTFILSACGGATPTEPTGGEGVAPTEPTSGEAEVPKLSLTQVRFATMSNDAQDLMLVYAPDELFWPKLGFTEPALIIPTDDILPALFSGEAWIVQGGTNIFWVANEQADTDLITVGIDKDDEIRIFALRPGLTSVDELGEGSTISGGDLGDWDELVLRTIVKDLGIDTNVVEVVAMGGGADARMSALLAGQMDAAIIQSRNVGPIERAGGVIVYEKLVEAPQEAWAVTRETLDNHRDAVCAFVLGRIQGKQWAYEGEDHQANVDQAIQFALKHDIEPSEDELGDWVQELEKNQSLDGASTEEALDEVQEALVIMGLLTPDYNWRDYADFSCAHEAQAALGLPQRP